MGRFGAGLTFLRPFFTFRTSPWLQWRVGKWVANTRGVSDPDGRRYDSYLPNAGSLDTGRADPLFHFGSGLSYTNFSIGPLAMVATPGSSMDAATATATVTNTGKVAGAAVIQLYVQDPVMDYVRPWKRLVGFARVTLAPGASQAVTIPATIDELSIHDADFKLTVVHGTTNDVGIILTHCLSALVSTSAVTTVRCRVVCILLRCVMLTGTHLAMVCPNWGHDSFLRRVRLLDRP